MKPTGISKRDDKLYVTADYLMEQRVSWFVLGVPFGFALMAFIHLATCGK